MFFFSLVFHRFVPENACYHINELEQQEKKNIFFSNNFLESEKLYIYVHIEYVCVYTQLNASQTFIYKLKNSFMKHV